MILSYVHCTMILSIACNNNNNKPSSLFARKKFRPCCYGESCDRYSWEIVTMYKYKTKQRCNIESCTFFVQYIEKTDNSEILSLTWKPGTVIIQQIYISPHYQMLTTNIQLTITFVFVTFFNKSTVLSV